MKTFSAVALLAVGCGSGAASTVDASNSDAPPVPPADAGEEPRACAAVVGEPDLQLELFASGLSKPIYAVSPPGDDRLFVLEQHAGRVRVVSSAGAVAETAFLDIGSEVGRAFEQGLLGLAFHPAYAANGRFFISFTRGSDNALIVEQWRVSATDPDVADAGSRSLVLDVPKARDFHNGGHLEFGPDALLYISVGDGGPQRDLEMHAQDLELLLGKILRIDIDRGEPYAIPDINPFIGSGRGEILAYGLRNPWTFSIDPATGHLYLGDVGFTAAEEIDVIPAGTTGQNFGWPILEGATRCVDAATCDTDGLTPPVFEYDHTTGCSVSAGAVYRGCAMPGHHGKFFFSDYCGMWLRSLVYAGALGEAGLVTIWPNATIPGRAPSLGVGPNGELFASDVDGGRVYKLVPIP